MLILGETSIFVLQMTSLVNYVEDKRILYECAFVNDMLFGMKFAYSIDRIFQTFLTKCMDRSSISTIDPSFYGVSFLMSGVQHQRFTGTLPPSLMVQVGQEAQYSKKSLSKPKEKVKEDRYVLNESHRLEWILPESSCVSDIFGSEALKEVPVFKGECKCCVC